jgi:hypothetical protein
MADVTELRKRLQEYDQEHLVAFWDELDDLQKANLAKEVTDLDLEYVSQSFER